MSAPEDRHDNGKLDAIAARAADGSITASDEFPELDDDKVIDNFRRLSALKTAFSKATAAGEQGVDPEMPAQWGHLKLIEQLGQGSFGTVYRAFDPVLQREVALKLGRPDQQDKVSAQQTIDEARRQARVYHPNVLAVHGADVHDGCVGIWADLIEGKTLEAMLNDNGRFTRASLFNVVEQLTEAVAAIHAQDLVHGDIKAENIMMVDDRLVLMDFGAARKTGKTARFGSPASMAPELFDQQPLSASTDLYAIGALVHRLATAEYAAVHNDQSKTPVQRIETSRLKARCGRPLARITRSLLSAEPTARPSVSLIRQRLSEIRQAPARRARRMAVAVVIVSLVTGLVYSLVTNRRINEANAQIRYEFERSEAVKDLVVDSVATMRPEEKFGPNVVIKMYRNMAKAAETELAEYPDALARLQIVMGRALFKFGEQEEGLALAEAGLELIVNTRPDSAKDLSSAYLALAQLRNNAGHLEATETAIERSLHFYDQLPVDDKVRVGKIRLLRQRANLRIETGYWQEALPSHQEALVLRTEMIGGVEDARVVVDYYNIGNTLQVIDRYEEALTAFRRAEELLLAGGDESSIRVAHVRLAQVISKANLGRLDEVRDELPPLKQMYRSLVSEGHTIFNRILILDSLVLAKAGELDASNQILLGILEQDEVFSEHAYQTHLSLARQYMMAGQWSEARHHLERIQREPLVYYRPVYPFVDAAMAVASHHLDEGSPFPKEVVSQALSAMQNSGHDGLDEYRELQDLASTAP